MPIAGTISSLPRRSADSGPGCIWLIEHPRPGNMLVMDADQNVVIVIFALDRVLSPHGSRCAIRSSKMTRSVFCRLQRNGKFSNLERWKLYISLTSMWKIGNAILCSFFLATACPTVSTSYASSLMKRPALPIQSNLSNPLPCLIKGWVEVSMFSAPQSSGSFIHG